MRNAIPVPGLECWRVSDGVAGTVAWVDDGKVGVAYDEVDGVTEMRESEWRALHRPRAVLPVYEGAAR